MFECLDALQIATCSSPGLLALGAAIFSSSHSSMSLGFNWSTAQQYTVPFRGPDDP